MYTHAIILDFEATCDDSDPPRPQEIIEFPSVLLSLETMTAVDEFESFVRPQHHPRLTRFCRDLTSIRQADIDAAAPFTEVFARHSDWLAGHGLSPDTALIATCGDWDLGTMLPAQCAASDPPVEALSPIYTRWHNVKRLYCEVLGKTKAPGMAGMLREVGFKLAGHHHRGIDDCRNIAGLYLDLLSRGGTAAVTGTLAPSKYPPISIRLRFSDRTEEAFLHSRNVAKLYGLADRLFKTKMVEIRRFDGAAIWQDEQLLDLAPGEELSLVAG